MVPETPQHGKLGRVLWILGAALFVLALAGAVAYLVWPRTDIVWTDGRRTWPAREDLGLRSVLWDGGDPLEMRGELGEDYDACLSPDGQALYFTRGRAGGGADLYVAHRNLEGWSEPEPIGELNTDSHDEIGPALADGGVTLYFYSNRPGGEGGYDLYLTRHDEDHWTEPLNLGPVVNSPYNEYDPAVTPDGSQLLFASNRPTADDEEVPAGAWPATLREKRRLLDYDIYAVDREAEQGKPRLLEAVRSTRNDGQPAFSPDGRWLYFASDRPGGLGRYDLYRVRVGTLPLTGLAEPENLGRPVNTPANELDPALSLEGFGLYFSSDRTEPDVYAIYFARSHEVFPVVRKWRPRIGHVIGQLSWPLVGLIVALAALALAILAMTKLRKRPGLLASALMISLLMHLVALCLFNAWELTVRIVELAQSERFEVALSVPNMAESRLSVELRTALSEMTRTDRAQFAREKADALSAPPEPELRDPEVALAMAVPPPQEIEVVPPEERPVELAEVLREIEQPSPPEVAPPLEPVERVKPKEVRRVERTERLPPRPVALVPRREAPVVRRAPEPVARPQETPTEPEPDAIEVTEPVPRPAPPQAEPEALPERPVEPVRAPETVELVRTEVRVPVRPVRTAAEPPPVAVNVSPLSVTRPAEPTVEPVAAVEAARAGAPEWPAPAEETLATPFVGPTRPTVRGAVALAEEPVNAAPAAPAADTPDLAPLAVGPEIAHRPEATPEGRPEVEPATRVLPMARRTDEPMALAPSPTVSGPIADADVRLRDDAVGPTLVEAPAQRADARPALTGELNEVRTRATEAEPLTLDLAAGPEVSPPRPTRSTTEAVRQAGPREALTSARPAEPSLEAPSEAPARTGPAFEAHMGGPTEETLMASTVPVAPEPASPVVRDAVRIATLPAMVSSDVDVAGAPEPLPLSRMLDLRTRPDREKMIEELGGSEATEQAVRRSLVWLSRHQSPDGRWDVDEFMENYKAKGKRCDGAGGRSKQDIGVTGLAALVFLGAGHTHIPAKDTGEESPYADNLRRAIGWIIDGQTPEGDLRRGGQMYGHAMATMVLCEAYSLTGDESLVEPVRRAVDFIVKAQKPASGWRYDPGRDSDTSVVGWQIMALKSAEVAGFEVPEKTYRAAANWLDKVRHGRRGGLYSYQPRRDPSHAMTAEGLFCEQYIDYQPATPRTSESVAYILDRLPRWGRDRNDLYFWYYATLTLHQLGGPEWEEWNQEMQKCLVDAQRSEEPYAGSWDPETRWGSYGGRVYSTALAALTLEVYYRFLPFYELRLELHDEAGH
jgi:hypothetical protein